MRKGIFLIFFLVFSSSLFAKDELKRFYKEFRTGNYSKALLELENVRGSKEIFKTKSYLSALCYKNLQQHDKAVVFFKQAIKRGFKTEELYYEYAQSLFALNNLEKAQLAFEKSHIQGYKPSNSLYYLAHISELLEDNTGTKTNYIKIIQQKNPDKGLLQVAYFRLGELIYKLTKTKFRLKKYIRKYVWPLLEKAYAIDQDSDVGLDIKRRIDAILIEHNMHPLLMKNGRLLGRNGSNLSFTQKIVKDSNVTLETDSAATTTGTNIDSYVSDSSLYGNYRFIYGKRLIVTPEFRLNYVKHTNSINPEVFQNDAYSVAPALRTQIDHKIGKKRASFLFDYEYNYTARDRLQLKKIQFYSYSNTIVFGEKYRLFKSGETTFKIKLKKLTSYDDNLTTNSKILYIDQVLITKKRDIWIFVFQADLSRANNQTYSTDSYMFRSDYLIPKFWWNSSLNLSFALTLLDTKLNKAERGIEKTYAPGFRWTHVLGKHSRLSFLYDYTKNTSLDIANYQYTKSTYGLELRLSY